MLYRHLRAQSVSTEPLTLLKMRSQLSKCRYNYLRRQRNNFR